MKAIDAEIAGLPGPDYIKETWWSIAIAAEPIARETLHQMSIGKPGEIDRAIVELIDRGLVVCDGGPDMYTVARRFYDGLRAFGGIYEERP